MQSLVGQLAFENQTIGYTVKVVRNASQIVGRTCCIVFYCKIQTVVHR